MINPRLRRSTPLQLVFLRVVIARIFVQYFADMSNQIQAEQHYHVIGATQAGVMSRPDNLKHKISSNGSQEIYKNKSGTPINITKSLPELAGKKITLSYSPATAADEAVINSYLPKPHADGTPIQPNELPSSLPAYLITLKPELRIEGVVVATGTPVGMGNKETFTMTFSGPGANANDVITNDVTAGQYLGIGLDLGRISPDQIRALRAKVDATKAKLEAQDFSNLSRDDVMGDLLYMTAIAYYAELDVMDYFTAKPIGIVAIRLPSESIFSVELSVKSFFGAPFSVGPGGFAIDVDRIIALVKALDGNKDNPKQFMLASGMNSSALEHIVPERLFSTPDNPAYGISAVKALKIANDQGIPIYTINQSNISTILPQLQLDSGTIVDIQNAVNAGKEVTVSKTDINYHGWTGCGYIIIDPITGAGAYMIGGGLNGGWLILFWVSLALLSFLLTVMFPGFGALILISVFTSLAQLIGSSFIKYNLGWDDYKITAQQGITAFLDIIVQVTLGALTYNMLPPGIASKIIYIFKTIAASTADWIIFFFTRNEDQDSYFLVLNRKKGSVINV